MAPHTASVFFACYLLFYGGLAFEAFQQAPVSAMDAHPEAIGKLLCNCHAMSMQAQDLTLAREH